MLRCRSLLFCASVALAMLPVVAAAQAPSPRPAPPQQGGPQKPQGQPGPQAQPQPAPPRPYPAIAVTQPPPVADPSFEAFRKQLGEIAGRKDRAALAGLVGKPVFWLSGQGDRTDKKKPPVETIAAALGLDDPQGGGWELLTSAAGDATLQPFPQRKGVQCAPAAPGFDAKALEQALKSTRTDISEWAYTVRPDTEIRAAAAADAPVAEKVGTILIRVMPETPAAGPPAAAPQGAAAPGQATPPAQGGAAGTQAAPPLQVVTPAGKTGWVAVDAVLPLVFDQLCYAKDPGGWKIVGYLGGE